ncbi:MAG TPA: hypothetical protein PK803_00025 [Alphaproteobacteria bacterium]|nr:hypothetical protein [Alphaproteobacteria bacterium]
MFLYRVLASIGVLGFLTGQPVFAQIGPLGKFPNSLTMDQFAQDNMYPLYSGQAAENKIEENWVGSNITQLNATFAQLAVKTASPTWRKILLALLIQQSPAPVFSADDEKPWVEMQKLLEWRLIHLTKIGMPKSALEISKLQSPLSLNTTPTTISVQMDLLILLNQPTAACDLWKVNSKIDQILIDYSLYCAFLAKDSQAIDVITQQWAKSSTASKLNIPFLMQIAKSELQDLPASWKLTKPIEWGFLKLGSQKLRDLSLAKIENPAILVSAALDNTIPSNTRLGIVERAYYRNEIPAEVLQQLYSTQIFTKAEQEQALSWPTLQLSLRQRAVIWQMINLADANNSDKIKLILKILEYAQTNGTYLKTIELYEGKLANILPDNEFSAQAFMMAHALYVGGLPQQAEKWQSLVKPQLDNGQDQINSKRLAILAMLYDQTDTASVNFTDLPATVFTKNKNETQQRVSRVFAILEGMNLTKGKIWPEMAANYASDSEAMVDVKEWFFISDAVRERSQGEALLLLSSHIDPKGFGHTNAQWAAQALFILRQLGLREEARQLAIEGLITNGL